MSAFLDHLDELRYRESQTVPPLVQAVAIGLPGSEWATLSTWRKLYCRSLGILGSAYRQLGRLRAANHALREALFCAEVWGQLRDQAVLLQRVGYLVADYGEPAEALRIASLAARVYGRIPDFLGVTKVTVDRGLILNQLGRHEEASRTFCEALKHLPTDTPRYHAAAHTGDAYAKQALGLLAEAARALEKACSFVDPREPSSMAALLWRRADLAVARGELRQATSAYRQVRELLATVNPYDCALGSLALCKALLVLGEEVEARTIAAEMVALLIPLERNKVAALALSEFVKAARAGRLTHKLVEKTEERFQQGDLTSNGKPPHPKY